MAFASEDFLVHGLANNQDFSKISCQWKPSKPTPEDEDSSEYFHCIDLSMSIIPVYHGEDQQHEDDTITNGINPSATTRVLEHLVRTCYKIRAKPALQRLDVATKIILVARSGYLSRRDILELRMRHSEFIEAVIPLSASDGYFPLTEYNVADRLQAILASAPAVLLVKEKLPSLYHGAIKTVDQDLKARLSFDWILPNKSSTRRVAMIGGRAMFDPRKMSFCYQGPYEAAEALGISVIVVDKPGHWLQEEVYSYLRDDFVAIDMTIDEGLALRIVEAVKGKGIDGIVAFADEFVDATVQAAETLDLPTEPVSAYLQSLDKYATRKLASLNPEVQVLRLNHVSQLDDTSMAPIFESLHYPMVVKPCRGGGSRGVSKVGDIEGLRHAVRGVQESGYAKQGILIETYADGPEVDANFALWDGEILFFEMCDDFPCLADAEDATVSDSFAEDIMVLPSRLDPEEKDLVRSRLHRLLLQLGFRSGVFHVEARVQNSTMRYKESNGILDLEHINLGSTEAEVQCPPEIFLVEVNPRPAGPQSIYATTYTYGIDFYGLQWLRALGDGERFAALCQPFTCYAQYFSSVLLIPIHRENIHVPEDYCDEMLRRLPEIALHVSRAECFTPGKIVSPVGGAGFVSYFLVYANTSRRDLLAICDRIKKVSRNLLDGV